MSQNHRALHAPSLGPVLVVSVLLPFLLAVGLTGWFSISLLERHTEARMQKDIELIARAIRLPLSHALERGYEVTVRRALESAFTIDRVYGIYVYDRNGNTVYANGAREGSMSNSRAARLASRGQQQGEFGRAGDEPIYSFFVPLVDAGERINGLLQITRRGSDFDQYIFSLRQQGLLIISVSSVALALIVLLGHRWSVGRHLQRMELSLAQVRAGDLAHRLAPRGPRELSLLAVNINQMLDAIIQSRRKLAVQKDREVELTARLHQSEKLAALGQLAAGVAHELGSPLSTVDGNTQRALRLEGLPNGANRALQAIRRETARMERIIRQLLDFGRSNPLSRRTVSAAYPLYSVIRGNANVTENIQIELDIAAGVEGEAIHVDLVRLEQAFENLLRNALQAARHKVRLGCHLKSRVLCYRVEDDGPGIDAAAQAHLFEPFFTTKPTGQGTGLGLAVAHAAVRDHGGNISVGESSLGGACFWIELPREPVESELV